MMKAIGAMFVCLGTLGAYVATIEADPYITPPDYEGAEAYWLNRWDDCWTVEQKVEKLAQYREVIVADMERAATKLQQEAMEGQQHQWNKQANYQKWLDFMEEASDKHIEDSDGHLAISDGKVVNGAYRDALIYLARADADRLAADSVDRDQARAVREDD